VPGGGLSHDGERWVRAKPKFLFSVKVLSLLLRGKLLRSLERASEQGKLGVAAEDAKRILRKAARKPWEVYSKPTMGGPEQVLRYLGRYTHRVAISNSRLVALENNAVTFRWRDRRDGNRVKHQTIAAVEFCRRFVQHIVPAGFHRIRHYGLFSNSVRKESVAQCRERLGQSRSAKPAVRADEPWWELYERVTGRAAPKCPQCGNGALIHEEFRMRRCRFMRTERPPPQESAVAGAM
jgi:hypothetical protein